MFEFLIKKLKAHPRKIVFTEGTDPRILEASARLLSGTFLTPVLVGNLDEIQAAAEEAGFNIRGAEIIDPETFADMEKMVATMVELRKGKMTEERVPPAPQAGQLLRHHAGEDGLCRRSAGRRHLLHRRHRPSRPAADQDQARQQDRVLLLHSGPSLRHRRPRGAGHGRLRHQHQAHRGRAGGDRPGDRQDRQGLRHRSQGGLT